MNTLFVCTKNKLRSPTGEYVAHQMGFESDSAGLANDAITVLSSEQIEQADIIFVMESQHKKKLTKKFSQFLKGKEVVCLGIPDNYDYMAPELIEIFEKKLPQFLKRKVTSSKKMKF